MPSAGVSPGAGAAAALRAPAVRPGATDDGELRHHLASADARRRAAALREVRDRHLASLEPEVRQLLGRETDPATRRIATQVLALGDAAANRLLLEPLKKDPDAVVRLNAAFGLARAGDEGAQAWLLRVASASRKTAPRLAPLVESALESTDDASRGSRVSR